MTEPQTNSGAIRPNYSASEPEQVSDYFTIKEAFFHFGDADSVNDFLQQHPFLTDLILEARRRIHEYFGDDCALTLQPFYDPEEPRRPRLLLLIDALQPVKEALRLLDQFDEEWWFDAGAAADPHGLLTIKLG
jgi:hypothetical protein